LYFSILLHQGFRKHPGRVDSIYFGGGTPSLLPVKELSRVFGKLSEYVVIDHDTEVTLEANPDDLDREKLSELRHTPVNRLSIGIQSFQEADLRYMNRVHSPGQALDAITNAQTSGFGNLTVDLIYGTPTLSDEKWLKNLERVVGMGIPHISAYALTVEKKTALDVMIRRGARLLRLLMNRLRDSLSLWLNSLRRRDMIITRYRTLASQGFIHATTSRIGRGSLILVLARRHIATGMVSDGGTWPT
jgi:coproporphyrinogen III oxidase-like Fe-S oxidoreductase